MKIFGGFFRRTADLNEELESHLRMAVADRVRMAVADRVARGESAEDARREAIREFGNVPLVADMTRERWGGIWVGRLGQDLKYALRQLRNSPVFTVTVTATLAIGLGATISMFTVVDRVLLQPLPYQRPGQLVDIKVVAKGRPGGYPIRFLDLRQWQERSHTLKEIAFYTSAGFGRTSFLQAGTGTTQVGAMKVSSNLFAMLGVHPALGREFAQRPDNVAAPAEEARSVILSDPLWRMNYGSDANILGKTVKINAESYVVVGVMPRGFDFPKQGGAAMVWMPVVLGNADTIWKRHVTPTYEVIARLLPGLSAEAAESELKEIQGEVAKAYTDPWDREQAASIKLQRYDEMLVNSDLRQALLALFGASGVLWLIACVNGASLMLARATIRRREIALRGALGASRGRIMQQLVVEGLLLSTISSAIGLGLGITILKLFEHGLASQLHLRETILPNLPVIGLLLGLTVVSALLCSVWPAMVAARASIEPALRQGGVQSGSGIVQYRTRALLVVSQIAMSLVLLAGCGLLLRTIYALRHVPLGFRTDHVLVANMTIPLYRFAGKDMTTELYAPLMERVSHVSGVQAASLMTEVPLGKTFRVAVTFDDEGYSPGHTKMRDMTAQLRAVGPGMQRIFGFRMLSGRFFNDGDTPTTQAVLVVNRAFAREFLGDDQNPGKMLDNKLFSFGKDRKAEVVGVLDDARQMSIAEQSQPEVEVYLPQMTPDSGFYKSLEGVAMDLVVRTERSPASILPELREVMRQASPELATSEFTTMDQIVEDSYGSQQLAARLLMLFGGSALLLCIAGIYGLLAYLVTQRTREMGVRIALGAQRGDVMWLVLRQAGWMLVAGLGAGLGLAYLSSQLLRTFLYGITPRDPWTLAAVTLLLGGGGLMTAYLPARRAAMVDPMEALRSE